jgi:L-alanine-DL-glutamate epimerase-like enolase superfamily enzyme
MKITDVEVIVLKKKLERPLVTSRARFDARTAVLVQVSTDEGVQGLGEGIGGDPATIKAVVEKQLKGLVVGKDPFDVERLWQDMYSKALYWDLKGALLIGMSGIETALWDIMGKALDHPVYRLLGGAFRRQVRVYASDLFWEEPEVMAEKAGQYVAGGFPIVKTHIGRDLRGDLERARAIRRAIGHDKGLMIDINCAYDRPTALAMAQRFAEYDPFWYEEPLAPYDIEGCADLRSRIGIPLALGENEFTKYAFKDLFVKNAVDYAMPDIGRIGGMLEMKKICAMAEAFNITCSPHNYSSGVLLAATLQIMACTPNTDLLEYDVTNTAVYEELLVERLQIKDGWAAIPPHAGLGVTLPTEVREEYEVEV